MLTPLDLSLFKKLLKYGKIDINYGHQFEFYLFKFMVFSFKVLLIFAICYSSCFALRGEGIIKILILFLL